MNVRGGYSGLLWVLKWWLPYGMKQPPVQGIAYQTFPLNRETGMKVIMSHMQSKLAKVAAYYIPCKDILCPYIPGVSLTTKKLRKRTKLWGPRQESFVVFQAIRQWTRQVAVWLGRV